jgi:hypothetical protein
MWWQSMGPMDRLQFVTGIVLLVALWVWVGAQ